MLHSADHAKLEKQLWSKYSYYKVYNGKSAYVLEKNLLKSTNCLYKVQDERKKKSVKVNRLPLQSAE